MRQTSEAFASKMLEDENSGNAVSFSEQIAKLEQSMNDRIEKMQSELLEGIAKQNVSRETLGTEVKEITEGDDPITEGNDPVTDGDDIITEE